MATFSFNTRSLEIGLSVQVTDFRLARLAKGFMSVMKVPEISSSSKAGRFWAKPMSVSSLSPMPKVRSDGKKERKSVC